MDVNKKMELKWEEITFIKNERESLFTDFETNKKRISELYFEVEIRKLQYMFLKRNQLSDLKISVFDPDRFTRIEEIEKVNETCIELVQKKLIENGYKERLQQDGLN